MGYYRHHKDLGEGVEGHWQSKWEDLIVLTYHELEILYV